MDALKPSFANSTPLTPLGFLDRAAVVHGDSACLVYNETTYTWSETYDRCLRLASSLVSLGIKRADVISVLAPNIPSMYQLHFAVPMSGAVLNTINTRLDARNISVQLLHAESKLVFVDYALRSVLLQAISLFPKGAQVPTLVLITDDGEEFNDADNRFHGSYQGLVDRGDPKFKWLRPNSEWDPMILNYTSGTTSAPKGAVHCHRGIFVVTIDSLVDWYIPKHPVYLWTLPMFHANGWSFPWGMAAVGGTNICVRKFDANGIYGLIHKHKVTHMCGAPVVLNMLANATNIEPLAHPVHILTAGAPPPDTILLRTEALGFIVSHGYGLTEMAGVVISCEWKPQWNRYPASERARLKARQGVRTAAVDEVDVVDPESGLSVKRDGLSLGEVVIRGASVMLGYLKDPSTTAKATKDGWFHTGDAAVMHPDGYLEIKDRFKDVIISGGENLSSLEVESVLYSKPGIMEVAVVARPHEFWGETPCAFMSLKPGWEKLTEKDIIDYCRDRLPHYMVPKTIVFKEELPRTSTGKVQKFILRELARDLGTMVHVSK